MTSLDGRSARAQTPARAAAAASLPPSAGISRGSAEGRPGRARGRESQNSQPWWCASRSDRGGRLDEAQRDPVRRTRCAGRGARLGAAPRRARRPQRQRPPLVGRVGAPHDMEGRLVRPGCLAFAEPSVYVDMTRLSCGGVHPHSPWVHPDGRENPNGERRGSRQASRRSPSPAGSATPRAWGARRSVGVSLSHTPNARPTPRAAFTRPGAERASVY